MSELAWPQVSMWNSETLERVVTGLGGWRDGVGRFGDGVRVGGSSSEVSGWVGEGAAAAVAQGARLSASLGLMESEVSGVRSALAAAADGVRGVEAGVRTVQGFATGVNLRIDEAGVVSDPWGPYEDPREVAQRQGRIDECVRLMREVLVQAAGVEAALIAALRAVPGAPEPGTIKRVREDSRSWLEKHAEQLRQIGDAAALIGKIAMGVGAALTGGGALLSLATGGGTLIAVPFGLALMGAGGLAWGLGDGLSTAADWGEGKISGQEVLLSMGVNAAITLGSGGLLKGVSKMPPVRRALDGATHKLARILERDVTPPWVDQKSPVSSWSISPDGEHPPVRFGSTPHPPKLPSDPADTAAAHRVAEMSREGDADARRRVAASPAGAQTPEKVLAELEQAQMSRLLPRDRAAIRDFHERGVVAERSITPRLQEILGDNLVGLEFSTKSLESLERKVAAEVSDQVRADAVLPDIKDNVRYTLRIPANQYTDQAQAAVTALKNAGFEPVKFKNSWEIPPEISPTNQRIYARLPNINSAWRDPETGEIFEIQIHTEASATARDATHNIYDLSRLPKIPSSLQVELNLIEDRIFREVPRPEGAEFIRP